MPGFNVQIHTGNTLSGKWDIKEVVKGNGRMCYPFENLLFYRSLHNRFVENVSWEETELFEYFLSDAEFGEASMYKSREDLLKRCTVIDEIYERIKQDGYRTQRDLLDSDEPDPGGWGRELYWRLPLINRYRCMNEVAVNIGRDGQFLFNFRGHHRLSIAKILDLDSIPVRIIVRHSRWQDLRNELNELEIKDGSHDTIKSYIDETSFEQSILKHPDLSDVVPKFENNK